MNDTKQYILQTAFKLFLQKSFKEVTMKEIVQQTGLSKGAFYHYFESKEKLFQEIINVFFEQMISGNSVGENGASLQEFYRHAIGQFNKVGELFLPEDGSASELFNLNFFSLMFDALKIIPDFQKDMQNYHSREKDQWIKVIRRARENGEISTPLSDEHIAELFLFSADGLALNRTLYGNMQSMKADIQQLWDELYASIRS